MNAAYLAIVGSFLGALLGVAGLIVATRMQTKAMLQVAQISAHVAAIPEIDHDAERDDERDELLRAVPQPTIAELERQIAALRAAQLPITRRRNRR